jgi:hypothetical protein
MIKKRCDGREDLWRRREVKMLGPKKTDEERIGRRLVSSGREPWGLGSPSRSLAWVIL